MPLRGDAGAGASLSSRAIAPVVGASDFTVRQDIAGARNLAGAAGPRTKTGLDGITALLAWAGRDVAALKVSNDTFTALRTRVARLGGRAITHLGNHRSARTGCTFPFGKWAARSRIVPAAELRQAQVIVSAPTWAARPRGTCCRCNTYRPAPTWAAPFPTSTPGREHRCSGTGWLRSEPTARLACPLPHDFCPSPLIRL